MFKVKTLAVLFPPYPRDMKTNTAKFKSAVILALACFYGNGAIHSHALSIAPLWLKHAHSFDRCGNRRHIPMTRQRRESLGARKKEEGGKGYDGLPRKRLVSKLQDNSD